VIWSSQIRNLGWNSYYLTTKLCAHFSGIFLPINSHILLVSLAVSVGTMRAGEGQSIISPCFWQALKPCKLLLFSKSTQKLLLNFHFYYLCLLLITLKFSSVLTLG
jgi:hypothetical protein